MHILNKTFGKTMIRHSFAMGVSIIFILIIGVQAGFHPYDMLSYIFWIYLGYTFGLSRKLKYLGEEGFDSINHYREDLKNRNEKVKGAILFLIIYIILIGVILTIGQ